MTDAQKAAEGLRGPPLNPPRESAEPAQPKLEDHPSHSPGSTS